MPLACTLIIMDAAPCRPLCSSEVGECPGTVRGCVYGPYILPVSSLYAWLIVFSCGFLRPRAIVVFPWQAVYAEQTPWFRPYYTPGAGRRALQTPLAYSAQIRPFIR